MPGVSYINDEPLRRIRTMPLYQERYCLLTASDNPLAGRAEVSWADLADVPLCLLADDMQNRRIIDKQLHDAGTQVQTALESNSMLVLISHVRTGRWASIMPAHSARSLDLPGTVAAIPIRNPEDVNRVGLLVPEREPLPALTAALVDISRTIQRSLKAQARVS
jgi:DNA-binding transcriptional LysR family regulator